MDHMDSNAVSQLGALDRMRALTNRLMVKPSDKFGRLMHSVIGASTETGEMLSTIKGTWIYGKPLDEVNILEECGDTIFYIDAALASIGLTLSDAISFNEQKLNKRYPAGYTDSAAIARADKEEEIEPSPHTKVIEGSQVVRDMQSEFDKQREARPDLVPYRVLILPETEVVYTEAYFLKHDGETKGWGTGFMRILARDSEHAVELARVIRGKQ